MVTLPKADVEADKVGETLASATVVNVPKLPVPAKPVVSITLQSPDMETETLPNVAETAGQPTLAVHLAIIVPNAVVPACPLGVTLASATVLTLPNAEVELTPLNEKLASPLIEGVPTAEVPA